MTCVQEKTGHYLALLTDRISSSIFTVHAADPASLDLLDRPLPYAEYRWSGARAENWYLNLLAMHPNFHGQGLGQELVRWGLERAAEEGVYAIVVAADGKEGFYQRCGYG